MSNCQFLDLESASGTVLSPVFALRGDTGSVHLNVSSGATYDLELLISNDGQNFVTYEGSPLAGLDSDTDAGANVIYAIREKYRFARLQVDVLTGTPDLKAYSK